MKGIIIWEDNERAIYCELINNASPELTQYAPKSIIFSLKGEALESSKAVCPKDDIYDFETGALISLMKMCGLEKSAKAYAEIFDDTAYGDALIERDKLKEDFDKVKDLKDFYKKNYEDVKEHYSKLGDRNKDLIEENKLLKEKNAELVKKGRIVVKVSKENYSEFCGKILSHFTKVRISAFNHSCKYGYFVFNKDTDYVDKIFVSDNGDVKEINGHKVVDWEDVR